MSDLVCSHVIASSDVQFGTSGARGLVSSFTAEVCCAFTYAFIGFLRQTGQCNRIALAIDNRPSSPAIAAWCAASALQLGLKVDYYGVVPTPALAYTSMKHGIPAVMVTGSHIPFDRNGLKFYRPEGEITKQDESRILCVEDVFSLPEYPLELDCSTFAAEFYQRRYLDWFPSDLARGLTVGVYEHSSAGRDIYADLLQQFGARVVRLGRSDQFVAIDTEALSQADEQRARNWSQHYKLDLLFTADGDGDRPLVADEHGRWLRGDILGLLAAKALNIQALAVPVNCNTAIEQSGYFQQVVRTSIGSPHVVAGFTQISAFHLIAGFEANGGFMLASELNEDGRVLTALPTRDAILPLLALIQLANRRPISELLLSLPVRFTASDRIAYLPQDRVLKLLEEAIIHPAEFILALGLDARVLQVDRMDGLRLSLDNEDIVHLRSSGNAPELRCYAESFSENKARQLVSQVLTKIPDLIATFKSGFYGMCSTSN